MADRISMLPDDILCHILSFLPTKVAVATSLISKRWNPLWLSVPILDFEYSDEFKFVEGKGYIRYNNFIESVISSRDLNKSIKKFRLKSGGLCDYSNVDKLVKANVHRRLEHLHLDLSIAKGNNQRVVPCTVPYTVFSCRTLVVLKLSRISVKTLYSVYLPSLKILKLNDIEFFEALYLMEILSACPILEYLKIRRLSSDYGSFAGEDVCENILTKLVKADICQFHTPLKAVYNVQFLRLNQVKFCCYNGIPVFQNLTELNLIFENFSCNWIVELLKHCPKLQILIIDKTKVDDIYEKNWAYPQHVPECLSLHLKTCTLKSYYGRKGEFTIARYIMQNARVLQTMTIYSSCDENRKIFKKLSLCPRSSATCELHLKITNSLRMYLQVEAF